MKKEKKPIKETPPEICSICFSKGHITNIVKGQKTNAWFCMKCGGLVGWIK